jgi:hypothetical protein
MELSSTLARRMFQSTAKKRTNLPAVVIMVKIMRQTSFSRRPLNTYGFGLQTICLKKMFDLNF